MAKYSGRVRVFLILILTVLIKITVADQNPFADPSLEIIKQEDAEEGIRPDLEDPNGVPCPDPSPVNGVLEVVSDLPFQINNITVKLKCLHGLAFSDGSTEKIEHCFAAPTPIKVTGIWYTDQGRLVCQESLICKDPKSSDNIVKILQGSPNHLYSIIEVSCPNGRRLANGKEAVNVTCLPLPDPCYCKASWETLDNYLLFDDFNCTGPNPVPCRDPTPVNGALEVVSGVPFVILNITVIAKCLHGLQFPDGTTKVTAKCLPAPTPYHITGVWVPDIPYECREPKTESGHTYETLECSNPKTPENNVKTLDGDPFHMNSKVQVTCNGGLHFDNGLETVNVTCLPLPHPCMCMAAWTRQTDYQLMYNFNCTGEDNFHQTRESRGTQTIVPETPPIEENKPRPQEEIGDTKISQENLPVTDNEARLAKNASAKTEYENSIRLEKNSEKDRRTNEIGQQSNTEILNTKSESESQIYENTEDIYHQTKLLNNEIGNTAGISGKSVFSEKESQISETSKVESADDISNSETDIKSNIVENVLGEKNEDERSSQSESRSNEMVEEEEEIEEEENENNADNEVKQIEQPPLLAAIQDNREDIAEEDEIDEAKLSESHVNEEYEPPENTEEREYETQEISQEGNANEEFDGKETAEEERWKDENYEEKIVSAEKNKEYNKEVETLNEEEEKTEDIEEKQLQGEEVINQNREEENDSEPEEETWEGEIRNYAGGEDEIRVHSNIVVLDETLPMKGTSIITDEFTDHYFKNEDEELDENNQLNEEIEEEREQEREIEESSKDENPSETEVLEVTDEPTYEDGEVERPGPLHEVQQTPFHRTIEEENQMKTIENEDNPCLLPPDSGRGRQVHKRYFFNSSSQECDSFIYGGSGGNENNFETLAECIDLCYSQKS